MNEQTTTTIKLDKTLYDEFRILNIKRKFYLRDLVLRCIYLYVSDADFREKIYNFNIPKLSPEAQVTSLTITGSNSII